MPARVSCVCTMSAKPAMRSLYGTPSEVESPLLKASLRIGVMQRKYFGTDGVRGRVGEIPITPELVMKIGYAAGKVLAQRQTSSAQRPTVLIGKDTRISGYMLESALQAGLSAAGVDILLVGPMPTPGV